MSIGGYRQAEHDSNFLENAETVLNYTCLACYDSRHGECEGRPCICNCGVASIVSEPMPICNTRHADAIRILRRVYIYLNCIRGMAFVGIEHPSEIQGMIGAFLDEENDS